MGLVRRPPCINHRSGASLLCDACMNLYIKSLETEVGKQRGFKTRYWLMLNELCRRTGMDREESFESMKAEGKL